MCCLFWDQFWKELLAQCYQLERNIFSRERTSSSRASWQVNIERLMFHFVVTKHSKEAMTGDLNYFFIHFSAEPGHVQAFKESQFCMGTVHFRSIYFRHTLWMRRAVCLNARGQKMEMQSYRGTYTKAHTMWNGAFRAAIANNIRFHHIRNRKPLRDSIECHGDNEVLRSIKTFTAELKDLLISVWATENAGKYWPQMYFFRLKL